MLLQGEGVSATSGNEIGTWDFEVDLEKQQVIVKQISGIPGVQVAALLGLPRASFSSPRAIYNNSAENLVIAPFDRNASSNRTYASLSLQIQILNRSGSTLGQSSPTDVSKITGVKLFLVPRSDCPTGTPTLQQPICVVSNLSQNFRGITGASGLNFGGDPVYVSYMTPRDGSDLGTSSGLVADDASPTEWNEPTAYIDTGYFARSVWRSDLSIPNGGTGTFGLRFRYAQDSPGANQPRVTNFTYRLRILAERPNGTAPLGGQNTAGNNYVTTLAGGGSVDNNGVGIQAGLTAATGVTVSPDGTTVYVAVPLGASNLRRLDVASQAVTSLAVTSLGGLPSFSTPTGVAVSPDGATVYVADQTNMRIARVDVASGIVTTLAGSGSSFSSGYVDGIGSSARFNLPTGVAISSDGSTVYVADSGNNRIRKIDIATQLVSTLAGNANKAFANGVGTSASFNNPFGLAVSPDGTTVYVADTGNNRIRRINVASQSVTTLAGSGSFGYVDGVGNSAIFNQPKGVAVSPDGATVYVADTSNNRIRRIDATSQAVTTVAGGSNIFTGYDGPANRATLSSPQGLAVSPDGTALYVSDFGTVLGRICRIDAIEGQNP